MSFRTAVLSLAFLFVSCAADAESGGQSAVSDFRQAKRLLYSEVYKSPQERVTFYCGCSYDSRRHVDQDSCGLDGSKYKNVLDSIQAEHILPVSHGQWHFACWREPKVKDGGKRPNNQSGRTYCGDVDPAYARFEADLHNLVPAVGAINQSRSAKKYGVIDGEPREWGQCDYEDSSKVAEPRDEVKGDAARAYLYMSETYNIRLSRQQRQLLEAWHRMDPVDGWERERNRRIFSIQGTSNPWVTGERG